MEGVMVPGYRLPRPVIQVVDTVVNIAEMGDADLPTVLKTWNVTNGGKKGELENVFRHDGTRFFRPLFDSEEMEYPLLDPFVDIACLRATQLRQANAAKTTVGKTLPQAIINAMRSGTADWLRFHEFYSRYRDSMELPFGHEGTIERAREEFERACLSLVSVDGKIWSECPEPFVSVDVGQRPGRMRCVTPLLPSGPEDVGGASRAGPDEVLFSLLEIEEARELSRRLFDRERPWRGYRNFGVSLDGPYAFSHTPPLGATAMFVARAAESHCGHLGTHEEEAEAFLSDIENWTDDRMLEFLHRMSDRIPDSQAWHIAAMPHVIERLENREINFNPGAITPLPKAL